MRQRLNERSWTGQLISWIQEEIREGRTIFQDVTNDAGIKLESGKTKFPDLLLFTDKISGIIFNGWELKFPDTYADDSELLLNALEKAKRITSDSFVTWNGAKAFIWKIKNNEYSIDNLESLKEYEKDNEINCRDDLADPIKYQKHEPKLRKRLIEILHDLEQLFLKGELKQAVNISGNFVEAVKSASDIITPQFKNEIMKLKGVNPSFRENFNQWKIYENSTLKILASSSRRSEEINEEEVLAKFTFYNLIGKIIFYLTLSENLSGNLQKIRLESSSNIKQKLQEYFEAAGKIDYQAIYQSYFTDVIEFNQIVNETFFKLFQAITEFDFKILPTEVIGNILENLIPKEEKQKFGQYFTKASLANLATFPVIQTMNDFLLDPTSGTGTFLNSFYHILNFYGNTDHNKLLTQIWGNDISHFPAILSVINLYKQKIRNQTDNFPRVMRNDYFNLNPGEKVLFPDSKDYSKRIEQPIPLFDAIVSNFPFIQQEDIPNKQLSTFFRERFELRQKAFLKDNSFKINERSDYFTYCIYNSIKFLKKNGFISAITSNAWLGKEYGFQFKKFLLDNFHIKYIVRSSAEHWFNDSKVSTIFFILQLGDSEEPTKFVTLNFKLDDKFNSKDSSRQIKEIENFYLDIDNCNNVRNKGWTQDKTFHNLYHKIDNSINVSLITKQQLENSIEQSNWATFFISAEIFNKFDQHLSVLYPRAINAFRGERTGWNKMFIIPSKNIKSSGIEKKFLIPYVKSPTELRELEFEGHYKNYLFVCDLPLEKLKMNYPGAYNWIHKFRNKMNKNGTKTIQQACHANRPHWYSLKPKNANIVTAINPYERYFFGFSKKPFAIDQRLVAITVAEKSNIELIAALLNSVITFFTIEFRGTSRNLGALDLNANYFKILRILNPDKITDKSKKQILKAFQPLRQRDIGPVLEEIKKEDRIQFDKTVFREFCIDDTILNDIYQILSDSVKDRVKMKTK